MRDDDEEGSDEKVQLEHGDVGRVSTGRLASSKAIGPRFYVLPLFPCEDKNPGAGYTLDLIQPPTSFLQHSEN